MKRECVISSVIDYIRSGRAPAPVPCAECGHYLSDDESLRRLGQDFADLLYTTVSGRLYCAIRDRIQELERKAGR
jgi:hypothetical protein